jgi:hypothetical protein
MVDYNQTVKKIIYDFKERRWNSQPMERSLELVLASPDAATHLLREALIEIPQGGTFLDAVISFLPDEEFPNLVENAITIFRRDRGNETAQAILAHTSLQSVETLHPHLTTIFELAPNNSTYYENWPWRESGKLHFSLLSDVLMDNKEVGLVRKAWECILETREIELLHYAVSEVHRTDIADRLETYLLHIGYEFIEGDFRRLCSDKVYHLIFDVDYLSYQSRPYWLSLIRENHPSWRLSSTSVGMKFGGSAQGLCSVCGKELHHLITFEPIPGDLSVTNLERLELVTCLSCLGWEQEQLFYKHSHLGKPQNIGDISSFVVPEFPATPFQPTVVYLARTPKRWKWQNDALSNNRENLHRVGGEPSWIQNADYPKCPECNKQMMFLMQLASDLPATDGSEWIWGDSGICYTFWCDRCKVSGHLWQCY